MGTINGTDNRDVLYDTVEDDQIAAGSGSDDVHVSRGRDTVDGGGDGFSVGVATGDTLFVDYSDASAPVITSALTATVNGSFTS